MKQAVFYLGITLLKLFRSERNLCQIILTLVRVISSCVKTCLLLLCLLLNGCYGVKLVLGKFWHLRVIISEITYVRLIGTLPVINIVALAPCAGEGLLSLLYSRGIVEVPSGILTAI